MRILLVEDDELLGNGLYLGLRQDDHTVEWVKDGIAAFLALEAEAFDCIVLDLGLPRLPGLEFLRKLRANSNNTPVLVLTAKETVNDRIKGLDMGADDYMTKPFELGELLARLRALQRRVHQRAETAISYRNLCLDPAAHTVTIGGEPVVLPRREFALLQKLLENVGHVLSREFLTQNLYGWDESVDSNVLEVHIHNIRKKLKIEYIRTIRGVGYVVEREERKSDR
jgi:two-component system, OmpR family, response regulator QseB